MWSQVDAVIDNEPVVVAQKGTEFSVLQAVKEGAKIIADGKNYEVIKVENLVNRDEVWLVSTKEVENVKSTSRRTED